MVGIHYEASNFMDWDICNLAATPSDILPPTSILLVIEETTSTEQPYPSSVLNTAMLTSHSLLASTPLATPVQSPCFIGGRTVIKEEHSITSNDALFLQYIKSSNCALSKRTFGMNICYRSSSTIFIEANLWTRIQNTYVKFMTLVQTSLPVSLSETCNVINVSDISFMKNTFFGIAVMNSTNNSGIVLNPTEMSNWCIAKGYETNDNIVDQMECTRLNSDVAVAALFLPWTPGNCYSTSYI